MTAVLPPVTGQNTSALREDEIARRAEVQTVPVCRPKLPDAQVLLPYLRRIDQARYYSNHGPLAVELGWRLAVRFGIAADCAVLASNGTMGLAGAILGTAGRATAQKPLCICPAFTFAATAIAAELAGYVPYIVDVDPETWALDPSNLRTLPDIQRVGLVMPVAPLGRSLDVRAWQAFSERTGIAVVVDAAACFDTLDVDASPDSTFPVVVSLHATKTMSTAEGGLVLCADGQQAKAITRALNFGFFDSRESVGPSSNGKLSEYHAAVGLADLDGWPGKRRGFIAAAKAYARTAARLGLADRIIVNTEHACPYAHYLAPDAETARRVVTRLEAASIETRRWYLDGLHRHPAFRDCPGTATPVTDDLAPRVIGLPFACDLREDTIGHILQVIAGT